MEQQHLSKIVEYVVHPLMEHSAASCMPLSLAQALTQTVLTRAKEI